MTNDRVVKYSRIISKREQDNDVKGKNGQGIGERTGIGRVWGGCKDYWVNLIRTIRVLMDRLTSSYAGIIL